MSTFEKKPQASPDIVSAENVTYDNADSGLTADNVQEAIDEVVNESGTIPVKATGAELDAGTDDAKFATAKALADSSITTSTKTQTLTNKRLTSRVGSTTSSATPTINTDNVDCYSITAQAEAITSFTTNLSGTPTNFQKLIIRIKDNGTARAITWGASFQSGSATLPTTTVLGKTLMVGLIYDSVDSKWTCEATGSRP